jgi:hypothetical protein
MLSPLFRAAIALTGCLAAAGQSAPPSGTIAGTVIDGNSKAPIRRAIVTLSTVETQPQDAVAWTDANGRFAFGYLPPGGYELRVTKTGFQATAFGSDAPRRPPTVIQLAAGETRSDFVFRLQPVTSILGTVTDQDGDPAGGVQITAMRWGWRHQKRSLFRGPSTMSDPSGRYRLTGLPTGQFVIVAAPQQFRQNSRIQPEAVAGQPQPQESLALQYYPGTARAESATLISVEPGREYTQIDFRLTPEHKPLVDGKIVKPPEVTNFEKANVTVFRKDVAGGVMSMGAPVGPDLSFHVNPLQPGSYVLVAQGTGDGRRYRGVLPVEVGSEDSHNLTVTLQPSVDISGTVTVEGPEAAKFPANFVNLVTGDDIPANGPPLRGAVAKDGSFKIADVPPGIWDINPGPVPPGGYIKSMHLGDLDVLTEEMVIQSSTQAPLKIVIGTRAATVQGDVESSGRPARPMVLLAPEPRFRNVFSLYRYASADTSGHFGIKGVPPGTYQLFALDEFDPQSIPDPDFQKTLESSGVTVTLSEGDNPAVKLGVAQ